MKPIPVVITSLIPNVVGGCARGVDVVATIMPALKGDRGRPGPGVANAGNFTIFALDGTVICDRIVTGDPVP